MIGRRIAHYKILDKLGAGGMGEVYLAQDTTLEREVAIKVLPEELSADPERVRRFRREAKLLATLNHPHIAQIYALEEVEGQRLLVMELLEGQTLAERIAQGPMPLEEALLAALQIAAALEAAHEKGIVHRDLKPANVMLTPGGELKVLDFGLAKPFTEAATTDLTHSPTMTYSPTQAGVLLGTAAYMSPEQARGQEVDKRSDIWAFGVVLWEMLTGKRIFERNTVADILAAVLESELDWSALPASTPPSVRRVLHRSLTRDPQDRLHDIADARLDLALDDVSEMPVAGEAATPPVSRLWQGLAAVLLLSTLVLGGLLLDRRQREPESLVVALPPPPGTSYSMQGFQPGPPVLAPDGRHLAFTADDSDGQPMLWVRSLADGKVRTIPGTPGASYPFWSPDSRSLGFFSTGKLRRVALDGGPPLPIADAPFGKGGSWNRQDVILFTPSFFDEIYRVRADGGPASPVTHPDATAPGSSHRFPHFLPDGEHFLFLARTWEVSEVHVGSLAGETFRMILESDYQALFAAGHLLFIREGILMAQPFDPDGLRLTGLASPLSSEVATVAGSWYAAFSSSETGLLAYLPGSEASPKRLVWLDRAGVRTDIGEYSVAFTNRADSLALSPDHSQVAMVVDDPGAGERDIWVFDTASGRGRRVTFDRGDEFSPVWSPDGRRLAFSTSTDDRHGRLVVQSLDSTGDRQVLLGPEEGFGPAPESWSADGRWLAYAIYDLTSGKVGGWLLPLDPPGEPVRYLEDQEFIKPFASFSPDGRWLAHSVAEDHRPQIYVASFPDLARRWRVSSDAGVGPSWDPEGHSLLFRGAAGELLEAPIVATGDDFRWSPARQVLPPLGVFSGSIMTDGERFLMLLPKESSDSATALTLVLNWPGRLKSSS